MIDTKDKNCKIAVIGVGPVGLATALGFAVKGYKNINCYDINSGRIQQLKNNKSPFFEKDLQNYLLRFAHHLAFSDDAEIIKNSDVYVVCVGTPSDENGQFNTSMFWQAVANVKEASTTPFILIIKSTVPIGTNVKVKKYFDKNKVHGDVVSNPEFLAQGSLIRDTLFASRIVIGSSNKQLYRTIANLYKPYQGKFIFTTPESAELAKLASNCYLAMRISYINDIANVCELVGANIKDVQLAMGTDPRIGLNYLSPGAGYGGSCFPKDTNGLWSQLNYEYKYDIKLVKATIEINEKQSLMMCKKILNDFGTLTNLEITLIGLSFKPNTDDVRHSIAVKSIEFLLTKGAKISVWDPYAMNNAKLIFGDSIHYCKNIQEAIKKCKIILILTELEELRCLDLRELLNKNVYDGRNCFVSKKLPFKYSYIGGSNYKNQ